MEELEKRIIALEALTTVLINGIAADRHCEWLNETDTRRHYYQVDGKLRYLSNDDLKDHYDKLVTKRTYLIENCRGFEGYQLLLDDINKEINRLLS